MKTLSLLAFLAKLIDGWGRPKTGASKQIAP